MIKRMVLEKGGGSWQNCRARRVSTSLGESGLWGLGSWEGLRESGLVKEARGGSLKLRGSWKVSKGLDGTFGPRWSLRVWESVRRFWRV